MATRAVKRQDGVLKLVYLGGFVELYWEPITAQEVMEKNPHHSVTRPDFWRYPWILIQPDYVLKPGRIFYIIPNHVISDLIKAYRMRNQLSSWKYGNQYTRQSSSVESGDKVSPSHRELGCFHLKQVPIDPRTKMNTKQQVTHRRVEMNLEQHTPHRNLFQKIRGWSRAKMTDTGQEHDQFLKEFQFDSCCEMVPKHGKNDRSYKQISPESSSWVESWLELTTKQNHSLHHEFQGESLDDTWLMVKPPLPNEYAIDKCEIGEIPTEQDRVEFECFRQDQVKKSCLRTRSENFDRKSHGRRVTFALPCKERK